MKLKAKWLCITAALLSTFLISYNFIQNQLTKSGTKANTTDYQQTVSPASGRITMIDLGATECIPCKMMAPIIEELKQDFAGKADIIFIDVGKNPDQAKKYGIQAIPTQIFFDAEGKEVYRHTGFLDKVKIIELLSQYGES